MITGPDNPFTVHHNEDGEVVIPHEMEGEVFDSIIRNLVTYIKECPKGEEENLARLHQALASTKKARHDFLKCTGGAPRV